MIFTIPTSNKNLALENIKVILLDLYVAWRDDPALNIGVGMSPKHYKVGQSRYNSLHIKRTMIEIVKELQKHKLIKLLSGKRVSTAIGYVTRIWASDKLIKKFQDTAFLEFAVGYHDGRETVILRDNNKEEIEYADNTNTKRMRKQLTAYNKL